MATQSTASDRRLASLARAESIHVSLPASFHEQPHQGHSATLREPQVEPPFKQILFFVNGRRYTLATDSVGQHESLLDFLRAQRLTSVKPGCREGGCGACTVMLSRHQEPHRAVNACLFPLSECDLAHIVTVEGLSPDAHVMHNLVGRQASQCGYCTPGMVMSMYTALRNSVPPEGMERVLDGNLCRCTGYRPLFQAATSAAVERPEETDLIFPPLLTQRQPAPLGGRDWFRPLTLAGLEELLALHPTARLVSGAYDHLAEQQRPGSVSLSPRLVPEMRVLEPGEVGLAVPMAELEASGNSLSEVAAWFGSTQLRNATSLLCAARQPDEAVLVVLRALGATVRLSTGQDVSLDEGLFSDRPVPVSVRFDPRLAVRSARVVPRQSNADARFAVAALVDLDNGTLAGEPVFSGPPGQEPSEAHRRLVLKIQDEMQHPPLAPREPTSTTDPAVTIVPPIEHANGEALYVNDLPSPEGCLWMALVPSTQPHARVVAIDPAPALAMDGVEGYFDQYDLAERDGGPKKSDVEQVFCTGVATAVGQTLACVVAETRELAEAAAAAVVVQYEPLDAVLTFDEAIAQECYFPYTNHVDKGEQPADADYNIQGEFDLGGQEHLYLETHALMAVPGEGDEMTIESCTQCVQKTQALVAGCLGVPASNVVVRVRRAGGGFGGKEVLSTYTAGPLAIAAARLRRPVRWLIDRRTDMKISGGRHPFKFRYRARADPQTGVLQALDVQFWVDGGRVSNCSKDVANRATLAFANAYAVKNVRVRGFLCQTNSSFGGTAFRGFGCPEACICAEAVVRDAALLCGRPVDDVRLDNLITPDDGETFYGQDVPDPHMARQVWRDVAEMAGGLEARRAAVAAFNADPKNAGRRRRGFAQLVTQYGINFPVRRLNQGSASVRVYNDDSARVSIGSVEMGNGINAKMRRLAADELRLPLERVFMTACASDSCPNTPPTAASVGSDLSGMAVLDACRQIRARIPDENMTYKEAIAQRISLAADGHYATPRAPDWDWGSQTGRMYNYFAYGGCAAEVEVDLLTGATTVLRVDIVQDVGRSLDRGVDVGQVEGSYLMGQGWLLTEEFGRVGLREYKAPLMDDMPREFNVALAENSDNPHAVRSSKAVGEPPMFLAAAALFAVDDALGAGTVRAAPATPERVIGWTTVP